MENKRIVITGGSSGIGFATAEALVKRGNTVVLAARSEDKLERAKEVLGEGADIYVLDVTREEAVQTFFGEIGTFGHLVTAAGPEAGDKPLLELDSVFARALFESKYWGQFYAAKYGAPQLREGGSIVMFSAWLARKPTPGFSTFAAVDGAIESLARVIAKELAPLRVNVVSPGIIDTPLWTPIPEAARHEAFANFAAALPVGRVGTPEDVSQAVLFCLDNGFVAGTVIDVDGGQA